MEPGSGGETGSKRETHPVLWTLLGAIAALFSTAPFLYYLALGPTILGCLLAAWVSLSLKGRAKRTGHPRLLDGLWIFLATITPAAVIYLGLVVPSVISSLNRQ